jgi:enamine deaminase RidA (YjgF/YER057c/UK114 family)
MTLLGRAESFRDGVMTFEPGLAENLATGDRNYLSVLDEADAYVARNGLDLPEEPEARVILPDPDCVTNPLRSLDLGAAGITSVVWATGYALDFGWLEMDAFDATGRPKHQRGISAEPGVYFLGLPWLSAGNRPSSGAFGTTPDSSQTTSPLSGPISPTRRAPDKAPRAPRRSRASADPAPSRPDQIEGPMTHTRIRPFNTRDTYPEQRLDNDLAQAVVARGTMIFLRGQCPQDLDTAENLASHDPVEQTHKVMQNIRQLIGECGGDMAHLCKLVIYLTDVRHREPVYRTAGEYIRDVHPVSTGLVVSALARPEWLVEIDATAVIPDPEDSPA